MTSVVLILILLLLLLTSTTAAGRAPIGVNWGTMMSHPLLPSAVVDMLKRNRIAKVKLFDADAWTVQALAHTGIAVMVAIPNNRLRKMNKYHHARSWVEANVTRFVSAGVDIRYVAVGNEPFLRSYNNSFIDTTFPALKNIQRALVAAGHGAKIKPTVPLNADVYNSPPEKPVPSAGNFRSDIRKLMVKIVRYLHSINSPFVVNIYPFLSLYENDKFPINYAFFDGRVKPLRDGRVNYTNMFDANFDTLVWSLRKAGTPELRIVVGEVGWPTDGHKHAKVANARRFYDGFLKKVRSGTGTPMRAGRIEAYLFGLIDEDMKSIEPGNFERHWGILTFDGKPKFPMGLVGDKPGRVAPVRGVEYLPERWCVLDEEAEDMKGVAGSMDYACSLGDCTALGYGSSCNGRLDASGNVSYAFNMYFQMQDQDVQACDFGGLAKITTKNASRKGCLFPVQIVGAGRRALPPASNALLVLSLCVAILNLMMPYDCHLTISISRYMKQIDKLNKQMNT